MGSDRISGCMRAHIAGASIARYCAHCTCQNCRTMDPTGEGCDLEGQRKSPMFRDRWLSPTFFKLAGNTAAAKAWNISGASVSEMRNDT